MENNKVSIILSAYNCSKYIAKAIQSVLSQTYQNFELIIVDDCSTDGGETVGVIKSFTDKRIKLTTTPQNVGCGGARYYGMKLISGDWVTFIDSDDWYHEKFLETLLNTCLTHNAKLAHCNINFVFEDGVTKDMISIVGNDIYEGEDVFMKGVGVNQLKCMWNSLSHISLWDNIEYNNLRCMDDICVGTQLLLNCDKHVTIDYLGYNYLQRNNSVYNTYDLELQCIPNLAMWLYLDKWSKETNKREYFVGAVTGACHRFNQVYIGDNVKKMNEIISKDHPTLLSDLTHFIVDNKLMG